jgi:lipopolysaccharide/colanic/teichoic acid biosynthesis glycosyltransferase
MYKLLFKRVIDLLIALIVIALVMPLLIIVIFLLALHNRGNVFFVQKRPGKNEKIFGLIKFKTMRDLFDSEGKPLPDKDRITPIGKFIRKTSIDELPQLFNVLKGDMSLIGPRPLLIKYLPLYSDFQKRRHIVKPGITGWAQVNGRNTISWQKKFEHDVYYVGHLSFMLDVKILFATFVKVFKAADINADKLTTMQPFNGEN